MHSRKRSILTRVLIPVLLVMVVQTGLLYGTILFGGTAGQLENNYFDIFKEKVYSRKNDLENQMIQRWSSLEGTMDTILKQTEAFLAEEQCTAQDLSRNGLAEEYLFQMSDDLVYLLRRNSVTGAFLILEGGGDPDKMGIYYQDPDPSTNPSDYSDLQAQRAPSAVTKRVHIAMDSMWQPEFDFDGRPESETNFYYKPLRAAQEHSDIGYADLGYWSPPFHINGNVVGDSNQIITYSVPLVAGDGTVFGVLGIDLSTEYLAKLLPIQELNSGIKSGYILAVGDKSNESNRQEYELAVKNGSILYQLFPGNANLILNSNERKSFYTIETSITRDTIYGCVQPLQLYNTHTPFENDQWVLIGVSECSALLSFSNQFQAFLSYSWIFALVIGIIGVTLVSRGITRPIVSLARQLREKDPNKPICLDRVEIAEIDELTDSIQYLSGEVADSAFKLSKILEMAGVSIGAFEHNHASPDQIFCTDKLFAILDCPEVSIDGNYLPTDEFKNMLLFLKDVVEEISEDRSAMIFDLKRKDDEPRWVRLNLVVDEDRTLGVFTDVTQDILEKRKIEHDRDFDVLTNALNRRAFQTAMKDLFRHPSTLGISIMIMLDLDNLKFINDSYGHDYGDEYIRSAADALKKYAGSSAVVSRLSGDEFVLFLYGFDTQAEARRICEEIRRGLQKTFIYLPDRTKMVVRASAGVSWYPADSENFEDLVRYSDFAMYLVKHTEKGRFTEFSMESYNKEAYLLHCREELNTIIEQELVDYQFQPIVDARTGEVFAFEALMRLKAENIRTPVELLSLARSQSKLPQIEHLTFFRSMECFRRLEVAQSGCRIFINSISNQLLPPDVMAKFEAQFSGFLSRLVIELTEEERSDKEATQKKLEYISEWGAELALDDYGVGYNGETVLVDLSPAYIKLDMSIVRNVHNDANRLKVLQNLVSYSRERGIRVIAEGVEVRAEMEILIASGVDYLQGYYLGKPSYRPSMELEEVRREILELQKKENHSETK